MSFAHQIKLILLGLLLFPAALFAQTSVTGRIDEGPLAVRPTVCAPGDYYVSNDTNPVVEYKCSTGNIWNQESGGGGGGAPGGVNGDTQCKSGAIFVGCSQNPNVRFVSSGGNDANSGLTWDTAKLTIYSALIALPGGSASPPTYGGGTVYFTNLAQFNPFGANFGIWLLGPGDPNYGSPPAGWLQGTHTAISIIGVGCSNFGSNTTQGQCPVTFTDTTTNNAVLHIQSDSPVHIENLALQGHGGRCMTLGIDSTGNRLPGIAGQSFKNISCGSDGTGRGPALDIGASVFNVYFDNVTVGGNVTNQSLITSSGLSRASNVLTITLTASSTAFVTGESCGILGASDPSFNTSVHGGTAGPGITVVNGTTITMAQNGPNATSGGGVFMCDPGIPVVIDPGTGNGSEITFSNAVMNGGGIREWTNGISGVTMTNVYTEGDFTHCTPPVLWFEASGGGLGQTSVLNNITVADQCTLANGASIPTVKVEGVINSENIQILGGQEFPYTEGSLTFHGDNNYNLKSSPIARGELGVVRGHLAAQTDAARHSPQSVRFLNFTPASGSWTTGGTLTSGQTDNDGGTGAFQVSSASGSQSLTFMNGSSAPGAWGAGDFGICGVWMKSLGTPNAYQGNSALNISCGPAGSFGAGGFFSCNLPVAYGDGQWDWYFCLFGTGAGASAFTNFSTGANVTPTNSIVVYAPWLIRIPSGSGVSLNELSQMAYDERSTPPSCAVGQVCDNIGPVLHPTAGIANAVTDWATATSLGSIVGNITGQAFTASTGAPPSFISPGLPDGNGGSSITTTPYTIQCDSGTTLVDRAKLLRFQFGAATVTVPQSTVTGCTGGFVVSVVNDGAGTLTFNRTGTDTFSIFTGGTFFSGSTSLDNQTSFSLTNGQYATLNQGATAIWEVRISSNPFPNGNVISANNPPQNVSSIPMVPGTQIFGCTVTSTSNQISNCPLPVPTVAAVGWLVHITNGCCGALNQVGSVYLLPLNGGTENIITGSCGANCFTVSQNATGSASGFGAGSAVVTVGPDSTTAATNITNYLNGSTVSGQQCPSVFFGSGIYMVKSAEFNITGAGCLFPLEGGSTPGVRTGLDTQAAFVGYQAMAGMLAPTQDFNFATCTGGVSGKACFFSGNGIRSQNIGINGGAASLTGGSHSNVVVELDNDSALYMFICQGWGASDATLIGVQQAQGAQAIVATQIDACGSTGLYVTDTFPAVISSSFVGDQDSQASSGGTNSSNVYVASGGLLMSNNNGFAGVKTYVSGHYNTDVQVAGTWISSGDNFETYSSQASGTGVNILSGGTAKITNGYCNQPGATPTCIIVNSGGNAYVGNTVFQVPVGGNSVAIFSGSTYFDLGGNNYSIFPNRNFAAGVAPNFSGFQSIEGTCTGTATSSSTLGLYGTGPNVTLTTCTSTTTGTGIAMNRSGILQGLYVTATHAGVNASSGVVTIYKNGVATGTTCTIGTGTSCSDPVDNVNFVTGDLITIKFTTQAAEVLAGVNAVVGWQ